MLLSTDAIDQLIKRNQLDLQTISDSYRKSKSISWLSAQVDFLARLLDSTSALADAMNIGPLHAMRVHIKVIRSLRDSVIARRDRITRSNRARSARTMKTNQLNASIVGMLRQGVTGAVLHTEIDRLTRDKKTLELDVTKQKQLADNTELVTRMLGTAATDDEALARQEDELDRIFGVKPEDKK